MGEAGRRAWGWVESWPLRPPFLPWVKGSRRRGSGPSYRGGGSPLRRVWVLWVGRAGSLAEAAQRLQRV